MDKENSIELLKFGRFVDWIYRNNAYYIGKNLEKFNLNKSEYKYLIRLYAKEGICQDDLVNMLRVDKYEVAKGVKTLIEKGYVYKEKDTEDKRKHRIYLTQKAKHIEVEFKEVLCESSAKLTNGFSDDEKIILLEMLERMTVNMLEEVESIKCNK